MRILHRYRKNPPVDINTVFFVDGGVGNVYGYDPSTNLSTFLFTSGPQHGFPVDIASTEEIC